MAAPTAAAAGGTIAPPLPLAAYLPQDRRRALAAGVELPERAQGAVLFSDIAGFTTLTEALTLGRGQHHGADEVTRRINAVHQVLIDEVERERGSVMAFAGDGMTCWFDGATGLPDACVRAVRCAAAMQRAMRQFAQLSIKIGVAAGDVLRVVVGEPALQRIDLLAGATVARAVAAEAQARAGEVLVDEAAAAAMGLPGLTERRPDAAGGAFFALDADGPLPPSPCHGTEAPDRATDSLAASELRPWVLPAVFERESASEGLFSTDLRPATALFLRVTLGSGPVHGDIDAQRQALDGLVRQVQRTLSQHGGVLLEVAVDAWGTCLYGSFGAARVHEDDPQRALRAAWALRSLFDSQGTPVQVGLASGTLCVGGYGGSSRRSFGAIGDAVNAAARLMAMALPGEVLVAGRVRRTAADDDFAVEPRAPIAVKGKAEPLPVFAVSGVQRRRSIRLQEPAALLPMVGREAETEQLSRVIAAARAGRGQIVRIVAEAGMGKSRLVAEAIRIARRTGAIGYGGACRLDGLRTPYAVWHGIWNAFFDIDPALPLRRQHQAAQAALQRLAPEHAEAWPLLGAVVGHDPDWPDTAFTATLQPKDRRSLLHALLRQCLCAAAADAAEDGVALLLVLEDLHAADLLSLDLFVDLARTIDALPVLMLVTERPVEADADALATRWRALPSAPALQQIDLRGLTSADVGHVVRARLALHFPERPGAVPADLLDRINDRAQGNPFYVEELLDYFRDRGLDPRSAEAAQSLELPRSLHALVLSRIDRLHTAQQNELKAASIIGREFGVAELQGYCPSLGTAEAVARDLGQLARLGFTPALADAPRPSHVFRHLVTQEVAYASLAMDTRARLHGQYARYLEHLHGDGRAVATLLAHHLQRADHRETPAGREKACHYLRLAGEQAAARFANEEALSHFDRALQWLPVDEAHERFGILRQRHAVLRLLGRRDQQSAGLDEMLRLAPLLGDATVHHAEVLALRARLGIECGQYAAARADAQAAASMLDAEAAVPPAAHAVRLDALLQEAQALVQTGQAAQARPLLDRALALSREHGLVALQVAALAAIGHVHWHMGELDLAEHGFGHALELARQSNDLRWQLNLFNNLGAVAHSRSRFAEATRRYEEALLLARRIGDRSGEATLLLNLGSTCLAGGDFVQAGRHGTQAAGIFAETGELVRHGLALAGCAESHRELGQVRQALALSVQSLAVLRANGSRPGEALVLENLGLAEAAAGRLEVAAAWLSESVRIAGEIGSPAREASALVHLGQVQLRMGAWVDAGHALARAEMLEPSLGDPLLALQIDATQALRLALAGDAHEAALQRLDRQLLPRLLADAAPDDPRLPMAFYAAAFQVLRTCGDSRVAALRARSVRELNDRAARIADAETRRDYLGVAEHRAILSD